MERTIGVIGGGFVGHAVARGFMEHADVAVYDIDEHRATADFCSAVQSDFVFLCLPSPTGTEGGGFDLSAFQDFMERYYHLCVEKDEANVERVIVVKSTVSVGFTERLDMEFREGGVKARVLHSPEFLTARCAVQDFQLPARNLIGLPDGSVGAERAAEKLERLYRSRFPGVQVLQMGSGATEIAKLAQNSFFATKVLFFNILRNACLDAGCDFDDVRDAILSDGRIAHAHTAVPGPDGSFGFGGACLPKDLSAFASLIESDADRRFLHDALILNHEHRKKD